MDTSRAAIPGVSVRVINVGTNATAALVSSETGSYSAASLPPGVYRIEASIPGFQSANVDGVRLTAGATARVDITLNLGQMSESVNVVADTQQMQTQDAKVSTNVSNQLIDQLPLVVGGAMRSVFDLVSIVPEAKGSVPTCRSAAARAARSARPSTASRSPRTVARTRRRTRF